MMIDRTVGIKRGTPRYTTIQADPCPRRLLMVPLGDTHYLNVLSQCHENASQVVLATSINRIHRRDKCPVGCR